MGDGQSLGHCTEKTAMIKRMVAILANRMAYRISRIASADENPFLAMQNLLVGVEQPIIFDVGAHVGQVSRTFREYFPTSMVYAFEPFRESFVKLQGNTSSDANIKVFNFGLSDQSGLRDFHSNLSSATNSLFATDEHGGPRTWGSGLLETTDIVQAEFRTIGSVVASLPIPRIDILKLDVQGAESLVMAGAAEICRRGLVRLVYSEIIIQPTYKGQKRFDECLGSFYDSGFDLYRFYNFDLSNEGRLRQVDAIFTRQ
jgi:FkbM family methyltransferase